MDNREIIQEIIGWTAFGLTLYIFFIPMIHFYKLIKGKLNLEDTPIAQVTLTYISCFCWYIYSDMLYNTQIKSITLIGMISNGFLIIIYLFNEGKQLFTDAVLNALIITSGSYLIYLVLNTIIENNNTIGKICTGIICILSLFQIRKIFLVYAEKNISYINICQSWFILTTVTFWGFYGYMISELYVVFPQIIFGIFSIMEITIFTHYKNKKYQFIYKNEDKPIEDKVDKEK